MKAGTLPPIYSPSRLPPIQNPDSLPSVTRVDETQQQEQTTLTGTPLGSNGIGGGSGGNSPSSGNSTPVLGNALGKKNKPGQFQASNGLRGLFQKNKQVQGFVGKHAET